MELEKRTVGSMGTSMTTEEALPSVREVGKEYGPGCAASSSGTNAEPEGFKRDLERGRGRVSRQETTRTMCARADGRVSQLFEGRRGFLPLFLQRLFTSVKINPRLVFTE